MQPPCNFLEVSMKTCKIDVVFAGWSLNYQLSLSWGIDDSSCNFVDGTEALAWGGRYSVSDNNQDDVEAVVIMSCRYFP